MRGEGVKKGKGRVKAPPYESDIREMTKGNAVQECFSDVQNISLKSVMTTDWGTENHQNKNFRIKT